MQTEKHLAHADQDNPAQRLPNSQVLGTQATVSPLVDRLGTPEGRTRALAALDAPTEGDEDEQRDTLTLLVQAARENPLALRHAAPSEIECVV